MIVFRIYVKEEEVMINDQVVIRSWPRLFSVTPKEKGSRFESRITRGDSLTRDLFGKIENIRESSLT